MAVPAQVRGTLLAAIGITVITSACGDGTSPSRGCLGDSGQPLPVAAESLRIDRYDPVFSNPTSITNPLYPISQLHSAVLLGNVGGVPFRVEVTLLPTTRTITVKGKPVEMLQSQYLAYLGGRIEEVAIDVFAQADDGSVWYLGEDVFNYANGVVADREGTWLAGRDGPPAMIMPVNPRVGNVWRPENICGSVFEEVTVTSVGVTVAGPRGPVAGAFVVRELHMDATYEDKTFAPGYGEFSTGSGGDLEAIALAVPTDALAGAPPASLNSISSGANAIFDAALAGNWGTASTNLSSITAAWNSFKASGVPPMLRDQMDAALGNLTTRVNAQAAGEARHAAIAVLNAALDFRLRHRPVPEIDIARFELMARQVVVDAAAANAPGIKGDATLLEWMRDRFAHTLDGTTRTALNGLVANLRTAADAQNFTAASQRAADLRTLIAGLP